MKKRNMIIFLAFAVSVCTFTAFSMLIASIEETKDTHSWMEAKVELDGLMSQMDTGALYLDALSDAQLFSRDNNGFLYLPLYGGYHFLP